MPLDSNIIVDIFENIVEGMRQTGTIDSKSESGGYTVIQSVNTLSENEVVLVGGSDYVAVNVSSTGFSIQTTGITATVWQSRSPYYEYGHAQEISNVLLERDGQDTPYRYKKYPLIALFTDVRIIKGDKFLQGKTKGLVINIIGWSDKDYSTKQRYDNNIKTVLYPLYETLIKKIKGSSYFSGTNPNVKHELVERPFWGSSSKYGNVANMFNDPLDALEMSNIVLGVKGKQC